MGSPPVPFVEAEFVATYMESVAPQRRERPATVSAGAGTADVVVRGMGRLRVAELPGRGFADYLDLRYTNAGEACALLETIVATTEWDALVLRNLLHTSPTLDLARRLAVEHGWLCREVFVDVAPHITLDRPWSEYYTQRHSSKARYNLRRAVGKLEELGAVEIEHHGSGSDVTAALDVAFRLDLARPRGTDPYWRFSGPGGRIFYTALAQRLTERGRLDLSVLRVGGRAAAFAYSILQPPVYYYYKVGMTPDDDLARWGPGTVLLRHLVERATSRGFSRFDLMLGGEPYKDRWSTGRESVSDLVLARPGARSTTAGRLAWLAATARQRARRTRLVRALVTRARSRRGRLEAASMGADSAAGAGGPRPHCDEAPAEEPTTMS